MREGDAYRPTGDLDDLAVPETLTALIAARLDGLDAPTGRSSRTRRCSARASPSAGLAAVSGPAAADARAAARALVRRELLVLDVDPRSPERGQYAFVQALIREVAYNTLVARRTARSATSPRRATSSSLGTDELAGGLAGHYLAAQRLAADEAEANALAAQARIALRGAAERAAALGSYEQARTFLEQALEVTTDPADRGRPPRARAPRIARQVLDAEPRPPARGGRRGGASRRPAIGRRSRRRRGHAGAGDQRRRPATRRGARDARGAWDGVLRPRGDRRPASS